MKQSLGSEPTALKLVTGATHTEDDDGDEG